MNDQIQNGKIEKLTLSTIENEGSTLGKMYLVEQRGQRDAFKRSIATDGLNYRLGKLLSQLRDESDSKQLSQKRLQDCSIAKVDRRRRSEAEWFFNNHKDCMAHVQASKKGFTSLTALQSSMKASAKAKDEDTTTSEAKVSNVGQSDSEAKTAKPMSNKPKTPQEMAKAIAIACKSFGFNIEDVATALLDELPKKANTSVVVKETTHTVPPIKIGKRVKGVWHEIPRAV